MRTRLRNLRVGLPLPVTCALAALAGLLVGTALVPLAERRRIPGVQAVTRWYAVRVRPRRALPAYATLQRFLTTPVVRDPRVEFPARDRWIPTDASSADEQAWSWAAGVDLAYPGMREHTGRRMEVLGWAGDDARVTVALAPAGDVVAHCRWWIEPEEGGPRRTTNDSTPPIFVTAYRAHAGDWRVGAVRYPTCPGPNQGSLAPTGTLVPPAAFEWP